MGVIRSFPLMLHPWLSIISPIASTTWITDIDNADWNVAAFSVASVEVSTQEAAATVANFGFGAHVEILSLSIWVMFLSGRKQVKVCVVEGGKKAMRLDGELHESLYNY